MLPHSHLSTLSFSIFIFLEPFSTHQVSQLMPAPCWKFQCVSITAEITLKFFPMAPDHLPTPLTPLSLLLPEPGTRVFSLTVPLPGRLFSWFPPLPAGSSPSVVLAWKFPSQFDLKPPNPHLMQPASVGVGPLNSLPTLKESCVKFVSNWYHVSHLSPWCFSVAYGLVLWAAVQITHPLIWLSLPHSTINAMINVSQHYCASFTDPSTEDFNKDCSIDSLTFPISLPFWSFVHFLLKSSVNFIFIN